MYRVLAPFFFYIYNKYKLFVIILSAYRGISRYKAHHLTADILE